MSVGGVPAMLRHCRCMPDKYTLGRFMVAQTCQPYAILWPNINCCPCKLPQTTFTQTALPIIKSAHLHEQKKTFKTAFQQKSLLGINKYRNVLTGFHPRSSPRGLQGSRMKSINLIDEKSPCVSYLEVCSRNYEALLPLSYGKSI